MSMKNGMNAGKRLFKRTAKIQQPGIHKKTIALATQSQKEYVNLIRDLTQLKEEYRELIQAVDKDKKKLLKKCI